MHEITAFKMLCIERNRIDMVNQRTVPIFFKILRIIFTDTFNFQTFSQKYYIFHILGLFYENSELIGTSGVFILLLKLHFKLLFNA